MASTTKFQFNPILSGKFVWNIGILWTTHNSLASRQKIFDRENFNLYTKYNTHFVLANTNTNITHTIEYSSFCSSLFDFFFRCFLRQSTQTRHVQIHDRFNKYTRNKNSLFLWCFYLHASGLFFEMAFHFGALTSPTEYKKKLLRNRSRVPNIHLQKRTKI